MIRYISDLSVYEAALQRINRLFDEFENILVYVSGGKDSTVVFELSLKVARDRGRLPLHVAFLDQEGEWEATIDVIRHIMYNHDVSPHWYQIPFILFNGAAVKKEDEWLKCWDPDREKDWVRPKDEISIKENNLGETRFHDCLHAIPKDIFGDAPVCGIAGVRCEESPARALGLLNQATYKDITWGRIDNRAEDKYTFYPLYDWKTSDIWKAIHDNGWKYNRLYDFQFSYGIPVSYMRVSSVHHETGIRNFFYLQEFEPKTYERLVKRLNGLDSAGKLGADDYFVKTKPYMFQTWKEYIDYLIDHLFEGDSQEMMRKQISRFSPEDIEKKGCRFVNAVLAHDFTGTKLDNLKVIEWRKKK